MSPGRSVATAQKEESGDYVIDYDHLALANHPCSWWTTIPCVLSPVLKITRIKVLIGTCTVSQTAGCPV